MAVTDVISKPAAMIAFTRDVVDDDEGSSGLADCESCGYTQNKPAGW